MASHGPLIEPLIASDDAAAFPAAHVFVHLKAEDSHITESPYFPASDTASDAQRTILEQKQSSLTCELEEAWSIGRCAAHVDGDNPRCSWRDAAYNVQRVQAKR